MPQTAVDKSRTKNDWHNNPESTMFISPLRASGQGLFALYMLSLGVEESSPHKNIFERKDAMQPTKQDQVKKEQGSCTSGDMKKSSGSCGTETKKTDMGSCSTSSDKGKKGGSCS